MRYPLMHVIKDVLTTGNDCSTTTPNTITTSVNPETTTQQAPASTVTPTVSASTAGPATTSTQANPITTTVNSGALVCRPTDVYADQPGILEWCNANCNLVIIFPNCPSTHCICDRQPPTSTAAPTTTSTQAIPTTTAGNPQQPGCRPTATYAAHVGMKAWCIDNCNHDPPYCPPSHCICDEQSTTSTAAPLEKSGCHPTELYAAHVGMKAWCNDNCNHDPPFCPPSHCICN